MTTQRAETDHIRHEARRVWEHAGLECAIKDTRLGFINGYVRIPEGHIAHDAYYDQLNRTIDVHGGLTYGTDAYGWTGFDTGHGGDYWPGLSNPAYKQDPAWMGQAGDLRSISCNSPLSSWT